jgi:hypothetical protein
LRPSHSTQCLFPSPKDGDDEAEEDSAVATTMYTTLTTTTYVQVEDLSDSDSEYSEYDLVNEQMQDFMMDSDDSLQDEIGADSVLDVGAYCVGGFMPANPAARHPARLRRRAAPPQRRRLAKRSESTVSLSNATRMTQSSSAALLSDLVTNLREGATVMGNPHLRLHSRKERRWLVPALAPICDDGDASQGRNRLPLFTVVLDLDETLVAARDGPIQLRPHVGELLRALHKLPVEIIAWTAGTPHYVNPILHAIGQVCGRREWFHHIISRHKRWYTGANTSVKDLGLLGRPMYRIVMVENNLISVVQQPDMCILLEDYFEANPADESLLVLKGVLERLVDAHRSAGMAAVSSAASASCGGNGPLAVAQSGVPPVSVLLGQDAALQTLEFRMEDVCNEDGVSMNQRVELKERVGGAATLLCRALQYSPSARSGLPSPQTPASVSLRSYGCVNPMMLL